MSVCDNIILEWFILFLRDSKLPFLPYPALCIPPKNDGQKLISLINQLPSNEYKNLCTGGAYYVTYSFRFISNKSWAGGEGRGSFT
jgi:hypothetical protein